MTLLKRNITANFAGSIWQVIMSVAFVPLYVRFLGVEAYGIIGIFVTLQAMLAILDLGISAAMNREMARLSALPGNEGEMRSLARTLEVIYWAIAAFIGILVISISPLIVNYWVRAEQLSAQDMQQAFLIMGIAMALQWPSSLYSGGLMGLQKQVLLNAVNIGASTLSGAGAVLILWLVSPTLQAFFLWQIAASGVKTLLLGLLLWLVLPRSAEKAAFQKPLLAGIWRFAAGMGVIGVLAVILTQLDKVVLSRMLTLEMFGYYALAAVVAMALTSLFGPVFNAIYPRFTQLVAEGDRDGLRKLYHHGCQLMSVLILPAAAVIALFSREIMLVWTQNPVTAGETYLLISILVCGTALNGLMNLPYALQLAHGWTRLTLLANLAAIIIMVPLIIFLAGRYGAVGGACAWVALNGGYVLLVIPLMHARLLPEEKWRWYLQDVGLPLVASLATAGAGRLIVGGGMTLLTTALCLAAVSGATLAVTALATPVTRNWLLREVLKVMPAEE